MKKKRKCPFSIKIKKTQYHHLSEFDRFVCSYVLKKPIYQFLVFERDFNFCLYCAAISQKVEYYGQHFFKVVIKCDFVNVLAP